MKMFALISLKISYNMKTVPLLSPSNLEKKNQELVMFIITSRLKDLPVKLISKACITI